MNKIPVNKEGMTYTEWLNAANVEPTKEYYLYWLAGIDPTEFRVKDNKSQYSTLNNIKCCIFCNQNCKSETPFYSKCLNCDIEIYSDSKKIIHINYFDKNHFELSTQDIKMNFNFIQQVGFNVRLITLSKNLNVTHINVQQCATYIHPNIAKKILNGKYLYII